MNRAQRRLEDKASRSARARRMDQRQHHIIQTRARRALAGAKVIGHHVDGEFIGRFVFPITVPAANREAVADYAENVPLRWHVTATCHCRTEDGQRYSQSVEALAGQAQKLHDLWNLREHLMRQARDAVNPNHILDQIFEMRVLQ